MMEEKLFTGGQIKCESDCHAETDYQRRKIQKASEVGFFTDSNLLFPENLTEFIPKTASYWLEYGIGLVPFFNFSILSTLENP